MVIELFLRTGVGANRAATAKLRGFRALSTEISAGFSTVASENWFVTRFLKAFVEVAALGAGYGGGIGSCLAPGRGLETAAAARFVDALGSHDDELVALD